MKLRLAKATQLSWSWAWLGLAWQYLENLKVSKKREIVCNSVKYQCFFFANIHILIILIDSTHKKYVIEGHVGG